MEHLDANQETQFSNGSDSSAETAAASRQEAQKRSRMDMPTIKIPDGARLKAASGPQQDTKQWTKPAAGAQRKPAASGQTAQAANGQKRAPSNGKKRPATAGSGQRRPVANGQRRPAARPQTAASRTAPANRRPRPQNTAQAKPAQETAQASPLDKLQQKLQNKKQQSKERRFAEPQDKKQQNGARFAPGPTLEERFEESLQKKKKKVFVVPIVAGAILLLSIFSVLALYFFASTNLNIVPNVHVHEITDFSITLAWDEVPHAEGYHVFQRKDNSEEYMQIDSTKECYYIVYGLDQATEYSFFVKAYNGNNESNDYEPIENVSTLLAQEQITAISSDEAGVIHVEWTPNSSADGYLLEFHTIGKNYREENKNTIDASQPTSFNITGLIPRSHIGVRITAFVNRDGEQVMGTPSNERAVRVSDGTGTGLQLLETEHPMVALTFDDGPGGPESDRILDVLQKNNAKATFFMVGQNVLANPENVQRKVQLGMELGNHSYDHERYGDEVTDDDILQASEAIEQVTGQWPSSFRSPGGDTTEDILAECANENLPAYRWSIDTEDWKNRDADTIYKRVMDTVQDGDIILLHEIYESTADAVERIVPELKRMGFELVTCRELVKAKTGNDPELFTEYFDLK